jgi:hypothetical protein
LRQGSYCVLIISLNNIFLKEEYFNIVVIRAYKFGGKRRLVNIFQLLIVRTRHGRSRLKALASLVIMWGSISLNFARETVHSAITSFAPVLSTRVSTEEVWPTDGLSLSREGVDDPWNVLGQPPSV